MTASAKFSGHHQVIASDVVLGENVRLSSFINLYGCVIGESTTIGAFVEVQRGVTIGRACKVSSHSFLCEGVTLEDEVFVGHGVMFINDRYPRATTGDGDPQQSDDWAIVETHVGHRATIGSGATIMGGVRIGAGSMIGAGAVVTKDIPPAALAMGVPAQVVGPVPDQEGPIS